MTTDDYGRLRLTTMVRTVIIKAGSVQARAELNDSATANAVWDALPISASGSTWGDEIYFSTSLHLAAEHAQETVALGDLAYWPPGEAICIFFGPTPVSRAPGEIRPASPVNVFGRVQEDVASFKQVRSGATIILERG